MDRPLWEQSHEKNKNLLQRFRKPFTSCREHRLVYRIIWFKV